MDSKPLRKLRMQFLGLLFFRGGVAGVSPAERVAEATAGEAEETGAQGEIRFANEFCILLYE